MSRTESDAQPSLPAVFVHPLLRARDWQDRPEFTQLCDWWRCGISSLSSSAEERAGVRSRSQSADSIAPSAREGQGERAILGQTCLAILQMLGLFDRPATPGCLAALRDPPIAGLTDTLATLNEDDSNEAVTHLVELNLVEEQPWEPRRIVGYSGEVAKMAMMTYHSPVAA